MTKYKYNGDGSFALTANGQSIVVKSNDVVELSSEEYSYIHNSDLFSPVEELDEKVHKKTKRGSN